MHLEDLVPELLARILQVLDNFGDLLSLVRASPQCFRVYAQSPVFILSPVLKNAILPDALRHALACGHAPADPSQKSVREAFLDDYFQSKPLRFPTDKSTITALCGLCLRTSYFVDDYCTRAMRALNLGPDAGQAAASALSSTERARMQRAFFRFELYCRVYPVDHHAESRSLAPAPLQFAEFLARMEAWEVEEMSCVHYYFTAVMERIIDDLEDQLVETVLTAPGTCQYPDLPDSPSPKPAKRRKIGVPTASGLVGDSSVWPSEPIQTKREDGQSPLDPNEMVFFKNLDLNDLDLFTKEGRFRSPRTVSYLASLGSTFVYRLVHADQDQCRRMIQENTPVWRDFLPDALDHAPGVGSKTAIPEGIDDDHPSHPSLGYLRFKRSDEDVYFGIRHDSIMNYPLRERAYVFWDAQRVLCPEVSNRLREARYMVPDSVNLQFNRYEGISAEERLKGVKLRRAQMERITEEFGSVFDIW